MPTIVAVYSLDKPHLPVVVPKTHVRSVAVAPFSPNLGPMIARNRDVLVSNDPDMAMYTHASPQSSHLLLLSSVPPVYDTTDGGHVTRKQRADDNAAPHLHVIWRQTIPRARLHRITDRLVHKKESRTVKRLRVTVKDRYEGHDGRHTGNTRYIHCPSSLATQSVQDAVDVTTMSAVGCTCTDMLTRGADGDAANGCKHILLYNRHQHTGTLTWQP